MKKAIAKREAAPLAVKTPPSLAEQLKVVKDTIAVGATEAELEFFAMVCKKTGLDPFTRQVHFIKRKGRVCIQTSIDGYRDIAHKTGEHAGTDDAQYEGVGKVVVPAIGGKTRDIDIPLKASVTVYRIVQGQRYAYSASARWNEYYPGNGDEGFMWRKMPYLMLGKVAEALALRKAFSSELSGVYTDDEMAQAGVTEVKAQEAKPMLTAPEVKPQTKEPPKDAITDAQRRKFWAEVKKTGIKDSDLRLIVKEVCGQESTAGMTEPQMDEVMKRAGKFIQEMSKSPVNA